jgi:hypothetical protein
VPVRRAEGEGDPPLRFLRWRTSAYPHKNPSASSARFDPRPNSAGRPMSCRLKITVRLHPGADGAAVDTREQARYAERLGLDGIFVGDLKGCQYRCRGSGGGSVVLVDDVHSHASACFRDPYARA